MNSRRRIQLVFLIASWAIFMVSLPSPAFRYVPANTPDNPLGFLSQLGWDPSAVFIMACFVKALESPLSFATVALAAILMLPLATLALMRGSSRIWNVALRAASFVLLFPWIIAIVFYASPHPGNAAHEYTSIAWGFYLYALAHTLAFIAVQIGCSVDSRRSSYGPGGFPVTGSPRPPNPTQTNP